MLVRYRNNNSGGYWWLNLNQWKALEAVGWKVHWLQGYDTPAVAAEKKFKDPEAAAQSWAATLGLDPDEPGCACCGKPHTFFQVKKGDD